MFHALRRIHVAGSDFSRSRRFYGETLGLPEVGGFENDWVEFGLGPVLVKLTPLRPGEVPARNQVAITLSTDALDATLTTLKERGVTVTRPPSDEFTGRTAEILDPDGYRILLFQPSEMHPDEEYVPMSRVDEKVKQKLAARRLKEKSRDTSARKPAAKKAAPKKPAPKKAAPKKPVARKPAPKKKASAKPKKKSAPAKKVAKKAVKKPVSKKNLKKRR